MLLYSASNLLPDLVILEHTLNGEIRASVLDMFAMLDGRIVDIVRRQVIWNGHAENDLKLGRTVDGRGLLSKGASGTSIAWSVDSNGSLKQNALLPFKHGCFCLTLLAGASIVPSR
jgi:hypothetical protein